MGSATDVPRTLSAPETFATKFILPSLWICTVGAIVLASFGDTDEASPLYASRWKSLFVWVAGTGLLWWACMRLKRVRIAHESLYISNYRREIHVPLSEIRAIAGNRWLSTRLITIEFDRVTSFGSKVVFMPPLGFLLFRPHPMIAELRNRVAWYRGRAAALSRSAASSPSSAPVQPTGSSADGTRR